MTDPDVEKISVAVVKALQQARSVSDSEHYDHHRWISAKINREKNAGIFWERLAEHLAAWGAVAIISVVFYALWLYAKHLIVGSIS